jgi:dTDP-glucose pyrophosphorylase
MISKKIKNITINLQSTLRKSMIKIKKNKMKGLIVIDKNNILLGTLTDGDLRKHILKNNNLNQKITQIYNKNPKYLFENKFTLKKAKNYIEKYNLTFLPVVDQEKKLVSFLTDAVAPKIKKKYFKNFKDIPVVIMAGGFGKRLEPFTDILPKALIPIKGKPIIEIIMNKFLEYNIKNFILSVNSKSEIIKAFFKKKKVDYKVNFIEEKKPLGTIGSLSLIKIKKYKNLILTNCDTIIKIDYAKFFDFHIKNDYDLTILTVNKVETIPYGVVYLKKNLEFDFMQEKPKFKYLANAGLYIMKTNLLKNIPKNKFYHTTDFIKQSLKNKKIGIFKINQNKWMDVGQWDEFERTVKRFK